MADTYSYNPKSIVMTVNGLMVKGYDEGDFIVVTPNAPRLTKRVGGQGDVTYSRNPDTSGTITLRLLKESPWNSIIQSYLNLDMTFAVNIIDVLGSTRFGAAKCKVSTQAELTFGVESGPTEWTIDFAQGKFGAGGNPL
uniref:Tail tube protein n=1 Tax=viral metagenome TaxID=1070528 RepID=A0A6M3LPX8_9ZZZZ